MYNIRHSSEVRKTWDNLKLYFQYRTPFQSHDDLYSVILHSSHVFHQLKHTIKTQKIQIQDLLLLHSHNIPKISTQKLYKCYKTNLAVIRIEMKCLYFHLRGRHVKKKERVTRHTLDISKTDLALMQQGKKRNLGMEKQSCNNGSQMPVICSVLQKSKLRPRLFNIFTKELDIEQVHLSKFADDKIWRSAFQNRGLC